MDYLFWGDFETFATVNKGTEDDIYIYILSDF